MTSTANMAQRIAQGRAALHQRVTSELREQAGR